MLASMIFRKEPFFHGHDNYDQVCLILFLGRNVKNMNFMNVFDFNATFLYVQTLYLIRVHVLYFSASANCKGFGY